MFHEISLLDDEKILKIRIDRISWEELFKNKEYLYEKIADLLLDEENLLYYATQRESSKTLDEARKYVRRLIENKTLDLNINEVLKNIGWNDKTNINNTVFQGDIGEYLMSIFIDKFANSETLISKISLKTSAGMPVFGNDNYYYDYEDEILYFGEAKFYEDSRQALKKALTSIEEHNNTSEIMFVKNHTGLFIAENNEKRKNVVEIFDEASTDNITLKSIIFIMNDDIYRKEDYENMLIEYFNGIDRVKEKTINLILIFFPILSKREFLEYFYRRIAYEQ